MNGFQLIIPSIGQQKAKLSDWKKKNSIYTNKSLFEDHKKWTCWDEMESPIDFMNKYGDECIGFGRTQKEAIINFCSDNEIQLPFWW